MRGWYVQLGAYGVGKASGLPWAGGQRSERELDKWVWSLREKTDLELAL